MERIVTSLMPRYMHRSPTRVLHLLQMISLHWHIIIPLSPWFTFMFSPAFVHSTVLDLCIMIRSHYYSVIKKYIYIYIFTALKILCCFQSFPTPPQPLLTTELFLLVSYFCPFQNIRTSYSGKRTICSLP